MRRIARRLDDETREIDAGRQCAGGDQFFGRAATRASISAKMFMVPCLETDTSAPRA